MEIDFEKLGGLVPAIIQDAVTKNVLMLGFMNQEALYFNSYRLKLLLLQGVSRIAPSNNCQLLILTVNYLTIN